MDAPVEGSTARYKVIALAIACGVLTIGAIATAALRPAVPVVERQSLWIETATRGPLVREISAPGALKAERTFWAAAATAARTESIDVKPGQAVTATTVIMHLDDPSVVQASSAAAFELHAAEADFQATRSQFNSERFNELAEVQRLESQLRDAQRKARADKELAADGVLPQLQANNSAEAVHDAESRLALERQKLTASDQARGSRLAALQAKLEQTRALTQLHQTQADHLVVRAGISGVVEEVSVAVGQSVSAGQTLAKIVDPKRLSAEIRVAESDARLIRAGQPVTVDLTFAKVTGSVSRIDPTVKDGVVTVTIALPDALPEGARPDIAVEGHIELQRLTDALQIARAATTREQTRTKLFRLEDDQSAVAVPVTLGVASARSIQVISGLRPGDRVITSDTTAFANAARIRIR